MTKIGYNSSFPLHSWFARDVTKVNKFVYMEMFNAVKKTRKFLSMTSSKTKSNEVERLSCFGRHIGVLERDTNMAAAYIYV